jgi:hypothetical protein
MSVEEVEEVVETEEAPMEESMDVEGIHIWLCVHTTSKLS